MKNINKSFLKKSLLALLTTGFSLFILTACGYKPSSQVIKNTFEDTIYVEVIVDRVEPENAPFIKDEMNRLIYTRFKGRVASKEQAESQIRITYRGTTFYPLAYENGYVTRYRAKVRVRFDMITKKGRLKKSISAIHEADIHASSLASSTFRTEAIRKGLEKALDEFMAYVSAYSVSNKKK
jgi:hypothetical protein